ncbi:MAG: AI-2E family transporter [bacterium]
MKKIQIDNEALNEVLILGKKILKLVQILLIMLIVIGLLYVGSELGIFIFLKTILDIMMPLFLGCIIAWLLNPFVDKLEQKSLGRIGSSLIVYMGLMICISIFFRLFIPVMASQIAELIAYMPVIGNSVVNFFNNNILNDLSASGTDVSSISQGINDNVILIISEITSSLPRYIMNAVSILGTGLFDLLFSLILGLYILIDFNSIKNGFSTLVPKKYIDQVNLLSTKISTETRKTVNGIFLIATMVFVCNTIGFTIIGLEAALLIGLICGVCNIIPYVGPWIGCGIAITVGFSQSVVIGTGVLIISILVQFIENYMFQPIIMSKVTNIHPIIIMLSLLIFGYFFGIMGMIFSTPILAILKVIILHFLENKEYLVIEK